MVALPEESMLSTVPTVVDLAAEVSTAPATMPL